MPASAMRSRAYTYATFFPPPTPSFQQPPSQPTPTQLLDQLLVLVQLLQVLHAPAVDLHRSGLLAVLDITQHAHFHAGARDVGQLDGARETLVLLGVVVLQANLELDCLREVAGLGPRSLHHACVSWHIR
eukprot:307335-Pelagomonas_calceolata.AAC.3